MGQAGPAHLSLPVDETKIKAGTRGGTWEDSIWSSPSIHHTWVCKCLQTHPKPQLNLYHTHSTWIPYAFIHISTPKPKGYIEQRVSLPPHLYPSTLTHTQLTQGHVDTCTWTHMEWQKPTMVRVRPPEFKSHHFSM